MMSPWIKIRAVSLLPRERLALESAIVLIYCAVTIGCSNGDHAKAVSNGRVEIPYAAQFHKVFSNAKSWYTHYTGQAGPTMWNSEVGLYGRYILTMQIKVTLDEARLHVVSHDDPKFFLVEVEKVVQDPDGRTEISYAGDGQRNFDKDKWKKIVEANGDLSVLDIKVKKDSPIPGFEKVLNQTFDER